MSYNIYSKLTINGGIKKIPPISLSTRSTDYYIQYKKGSTRLDNISYDYYGDPNYDWLILEANRDIALFEFNIPDGATLRIPYPLTSYIEEINSKIESYNALYGID
jgi:hypothetical protein